MELIIYRLKAYLDNNGFDIINKKNFTNKAFNDAEDEISYILVENNDNKI